jgi:hypothetical protein
VHTRDLWIGPEAAGRLVNALEFTLEDLDGTYERAQVSDPDLSPAPEPKSPIDVLVVGGWSVDHRRQVAPETTGAGCWDCVGGLDGGASWPDPEEVPDVEDPVVVVFVAGDGVDVLWAVEEWPGKALLK